MKNKIIGAILFLSGLLVLLTPRFILPVCEYQGFTPMACSHTGVSEMFLGVIIMTASAGIYFSRTPETLRWLAITAFIAGLSVLLIPNAIGYCRSDRMPCNYGTVPALRLLGSCINLASLAGVILSFKKGPE